MAETVGLVLSGVSLVSLFNTCMGCFDYFRVGRQFGHDFEMYQLKLEVLHLRFSRWREISKTYDWDCTPSEEQRRVKEVLRQVEGAFREVERHMDSTSQSMEGTANATSLNASTSFDVLPVSETVRDLALRRQNSTSQAKKAAWALCRRHEVVKFITDLTHLLDSLDHLMPKAAAQQQDLCQQDVMEIIQEYGTGPKEILGGATEDADPQFYTYLQQAEPAGSYSYDHVSAKDNAQQLNATEVPEGVDYVPRGHYRYRNVVALGNAKQHNGTKVVRVGGKGFLD